MSDHSIENHYSVAELERVILDALQTMGKDVEDLRPDDLSPVDEFHIRGRDATIELARLVEPRSDWRVLDVGSGLGGTCRYLAAEHGCVVTGIDLTRAYCETASRLSARVGLSDRTTFRHGSALEMPFEDAEFHSVWTEHAQMNIEDKPSLYSEIHRVLEAGGRFAFHDIFGGDGQPLHFPVPWADEPDISFLLSARQVRQILTDLGFEVQHWDDKTDASLHWFRGNMGRMKANGPPPLGVHLLMGPSAVTKFQNIIRNLDEGRAVVIQAVLVKSS